MEFTYSGYRELLLLLAQHQYSFADYHDYECAEKAVILRHDIDTDIGKAVEMAKCECELRVKSTYFVLLKTDFYNPASQKSLSQLRSIQEMGHEIGLHFDEKAYPAASTEQVIDHILNERDILSNIIGTPVTCVSMHRPSQMTLEADLQIPGMINSYGQVFFHGFKYLSDSRRRWREPVLEIVQSDMYRRLHILTHAFWYHEQEESIYDTTKRFLQSAVSQRYDQLKDNITDLDSIIHRDEVCGL